MFMMLMVYYFVNFVNSFLLESVIFGFLYIDIILCDCAKLTFTSSNFSVKSKWFLRINHYLNIVTVNSLPPLPLLSFLSSLPASLTFPHAHWPGLPDNVGCAWGKQTYLPSSFCCWRSRIQCFREEHGVVIRASCFGPRNVLDQNEGLLLCPWFPESSSHGAEGQGTRHFAAVAKVILSSCLPSVNAVSCIAWFPTLTTLHLWNELQLMSYPLIKS